MTCQECIPEFGEECINAATYIKGQESNNFKRTDDIKSYEKSPSKTVKRFLYRYFGEQVLP